MSIGYRIKDVADRTGFTTATLRYYEEIGLLPMAKRSPSGYRVYEADTIDRLTFISRAKQLGCSLDEIADLSVAWEGGACGPIQERLRTVVREKIADAQTRLVGLMTLTADLQRAATELERHRPDGPCDDNCGCLGEPADAPRTLQPVNLGPKPNPQIEISCTLSPNALPGRLDDWNVLLVSATRRETIERGMRVTFGPTVSTGDLMRLAFDEHDCCQFFEFAITIDRRGLALEVRAPAEAVDLVHTVFGAQG